MSASSHSPCKLALVGMMASGKTTVGRMVAEALGWPYLDNDERLVARAGRSAREVEDHDGLDALHALEAAVLLEALAEEGPAVVAAAASTIDDPACRDGPRGTTERSVAVARSSGRITPVGVRIRPGL